MNLTPRERDKLMIALAAIVARSRRARGVKLNYPESIALITDFVLEGARDGKSVAELASESGKILRRDEVMEGIAEMIAEMQTLVQFQKEATERAAALFKLDAISVDDYAASQQTLTELQSLALDVGKSVGNKNK